mgnify:FL=1
MGTHACWVLKDNEVIGHTHFNSTCDFAATRIFDTFDECWNSDPEHWYRQCSCGKPSAPVNLFTVYARIYWTADACLECMALTGRYELDMDPRLSRQLGWPSTIEMPAEIKEYLRT